jgi:hypothetical protein
MAIAYNVVEALLFTGDTKRSAPEVTEMKRLQ